MRCTRWLIRFSIVLMFTACLACNGVSSTHMPPAGPGKPPLEASGQALLAGSGQALLQVGNLFIAAGGLYTANCTPTLANPKLAGFCSAFKTFAPEFQKAYPPAVQTWQAARETNDTASAEGAEAAIMSLMSDLVAIMAQAYPNM